MHIDENRPNIKVVCNGDTYLVHTAYRDYNGDILGSASLQGKSNPSPIVIANPLPPFFIGEGGQPQPIMQQHTQKGLQDTGNASVVPVSSPANQPPSFIPTQKKVEPFNGDGGSLMSCLYHFAYVWPKQHKPGYWFYLTDVNKDSMMGYMWTGYRYVYKVIETNDIEYYQCY